MRTYRATFSDGETLTRNSSRAFSYAWKFLDQRNDRGIPKHGFHATRELAEKESAREVRWIEKLSGRRYETEIVAVTAS